ncbi:MAG: hypothetical protein IPP40_09910 [bacterium]|nr:hypothetical protein [bacterium]
MKKQFSSLFRPISLLLGLATASLWVIGCSLIEPPTASNDATETVNNLWSPQLGDELVPGRQIPIILDENYWETPGMVNPSLRGLTNATPVPYQRYDGWNSCGVGTTIYGASRAISGTINFTLALASGSGIGVDCGPSPLNFNAGVPVRLTLSYAGTQYDPDYCQRVGIEPLDASLLQIWYAPANGDAPVRQDRGRIFDAGTKTISVQVDHFSRYIVA